MQSHWVEFKLEDVLISIPLESILQYSHDSENHNKTIVKYLSNGEVNTIYVDGSYDQVKQKILNAGKFEPIRTTEPFNGEEYIYGVRNIEESNPFTRDEYKRLYALAMCEKVECEKDNIPEQVEYIGKLVDKLEKIINNEK